MSPTNEQRPKLRDWIKLADDSENEGCYVVDNRCDLPPSGEMYCRHDMGIHLHVRYVRSTNHKCGTQFCADLQRWEFPFMEVNHLARLQGIALWWAPREDVGNGCYYVWEAVFVAVGDSVQEGEWMVIGSDERVLAVADPSFVRLKPLDSCGVRAPELPHVATLSVEPPSLSSPPTPRRGMNREVDSLSLAKSKDATDPAGFGQSELIGEMVKGRPEIVGHITYTERHLTQQRGDALRYVGDPEDVVSAGRVILADGSWALSFDHERIGHVSLESVAMTFCPFELRPTAGEINRPHDVQSHLDGQDVAD